MTISQNLISSRVLPPDVSEEDFDAALAELTQLLGEEWVISDPGKVSEYEDRFPVGDSERFRPGAAVFPGSVEDVQAIIRIANEFRVPISPVSTGRNLGYGGSAPRLSGAIVVATGERMNKIIEVNEKYAYALVEPGVSFFDLYNHIQEKGYDLWLSVPDLGWGSITGNALERGVGYSPYGDHWQWATGMEVVLPDGDLMRTGMGAMSNADTWQLFPYGYGPTADGLFTQSNYGIVTKMGIALMPKPPASESYLITFEHETDLPEIVEIMRPLRIGMTPMQNVPVLRNIFIDTAVVSKRTDWFQGEGPCPPEVIEKMKKDLNLGYWNLYGTAYGTEEQNDFNLGLIKEAFLKIPGAKFYTTKDRPEEGDPGAHVLHNRHDINRGIPSLSESKLFEWVPNGGHVCFAPVSAPSGEDAWKQYEMVRDRCTQYEADYAAQFCVGLRQMHHIALMMYDTKDEEVSRQMLEMTSYMIDDAAKEGYGEYRTHLALMDQVAETFDFNDGAQLRFQEKIKDCLDPNGIIAPGKSGIWGSRYKDQNL
jgi:4-cresol dehydrogenase (hydroxylating) flavoprotein subunit